MLAVIGCSDAATPTGRYAFTTTSCDRYHPTAIVFDGDKTYLDNPTPGYPTGAAFPNPVLFDGTHVDFHVDRHINVGDTDFTEVCSERWALDVDDASLSGSGSGSCDGSSLHSPIGCAGDFTVTGMRTP